MRVPVLLAAGLACGCGGQSLDLLEGLAGTIHTLAGSGVRGRGGDGAAATAAELASPVDVAVGNDGRIWISDFDNNRIRAVDAHGIIRTVVGIGDTGDSPDHGAPTCPAEEALFDHVSNIAFHGGYLYMAAWRNNRIKRVQLEEMTLENFAGTGALLPYAGDGGPALEAAFDRPASVAFAPDGGVVLLDQRNQVLRRVDPSGEVHRLAGQCIVERDDRSIDPARCVDSAVPVACPGSDKTTACTQDLASCEYACTPGYSGDGGPATEARIAMSIGDGAAPGGHLLYDRAGNLLLADSDNHRIRKIDPAGIITTVAGTGDPGADGDGGPATAAAIGHPVGLALGEDGTIYFSDDVHDCVRAIDPQGDVHTIAGRCDATSCTDGACFGGDDGPALTARLHAPRGLAVDGKRLYIADSGNERVRYVELR